MKYNWDRVLKRKVLNAQKSTLLKGKVGLVVPGGTTIVDVPGQPGRIYVQIQRTEGVSIVTALNNGTTRTAGSDVILQEAEASAIGLTGDTEYVVVGQLVAKDADSSVPDAGVPPHDHDFGSGMIDYISARRYLPGLVFRKEGMIAKINSFWYRKSDRTLKFFPGSTVDLTSYIPSTPFEHCWCVVSIDETDNTIAVDTTDPVGLATPLTTAMIEALELTTLPLAAVQLRAGMTQIPADKKTDSKWLDLRNILSGGASDMPAGDIAKNLFWAGPVTDPAAPASFRAIDPDDLTEAMKTPPAIGETTSAPGYFSSLSVSDGTIGKFFTSTNRFIIQVVEGAGLNFYRAYGSLTDPEIVEAGASVGLISAGSWITSSSYGENSEIGFHTTQDHTGTNRGTQIRLRTTPNNSNTLTTRLVVDQDGAIILTPGTVAAHSIGESVSSYRVNSNSLNHSLRLQRARASSANVNANDILGDIGFYGMGSSIGNASAAIRADATHNFSGTSHPATLKFYTTNQNQTSPNLVMTLDETGRLIALGATIQPMSGSVPGSIDILGASSGTVGASMIWYGASGFSTLYMDRSSHHFRIYRNDATASATTFEIGQFNGSGGAINLYLHQGLTVIGSVLLPTAAPGSLTNGNIWYDSTLFNLFARIGGLSQTFSSILFQQATDVSVSNNAAETTLISATSALGSMTLPANYGKQYKSFGFVMRGTIRGNLTTNTLILRFKTTTGTTVTLSLSTPDLSAAAVPYELRGEFQIRTAGSSGNLRGRLMLLIQGQSPVFSNMVSGSVDWTAAQTFDVTADWTSAALNHTIDNDFFRMSAYR